MEDEAAPEREEGLVGARPALVAHRQAPAAPEPGPRALHHPAVAAAAPLRRDPDPCDPAGDAPPAAGLPAPPVVVPLVGVQLARPLAALAAGPLGGGTASSVASSIMESCRLAGPTRAASGTPLAAVSTRGLPPGRPRSVGLRPVPWPPFWPGRWRWPGRRAPRRSGRRPPARRAGRGGRRPPPRRPAGRAAGASGWRGWPSPAPVAPPITGRRSRVPGLLHRQPTEPRPHWCGCSQRNRVSAVFCGGDCARVRAGRR